MRYSSAPASKPATTSLESALAVTMMMGIKGSDGIAFEALANLDAIHLGHHDIQQHQVGLMGTGQFQRCFAVSGGENVVAVHRETRLQDVHVHRLIVHDEELRWCFHVGFLLALVG